MEDVALKLKIYHQLVFDQTFIRLDKLSNRLIAIAMLRFF